LGVQEALEGEPGVPAAALQSRALEEVYVAESSPGSGFLKKREHSCGPA